MRPFSLYLHIPYCVAKCPYCDFNSYAAAEWPEQRYVGALSAELAHYAALPEWHEGEIQTIFFGGGTPSLFAGASIGAVLDTAARYWRLSANVEVTLEANPGTVSPERLRDLRAAGVNRMSFGVQSFHARHLQTLGRIHSADDAVAAVGWARDAGFARVSLDLIYALPEQTLAEWEHDLTRACELQPEHVSAYNLTYEEGTAFHQWRAQGRLHQLPEEMEIALFTGTQEILAGAGYEQYEISNYSRPGEACRHNLNYWHSGSYLGVGAGAHSYWQAPHQTAGENGYRWSNHKSPVQYITACEGDGHARATHEVLDVRQSRGEFVFLGLRCLDGFAADTFHRRFGADLTEVFPHAIGLRDDELLTCRDGRWHLTARGLLLADSVFATFL